MKPQLNIITLAVENLERSLEFYRDGLGFHTDGIMGAEFGGSDEQAAGAVVMFRLSGGLTLALYPRTELVKDSGQEAGSPNNVEFSLGYFAGTKEEVDTILALAQKAGATITDPAHERPWGIYSGYFKDPDGHLWEIIWNPQST